LNPEAVDGYKVVRIKEPASKRRKKMVIDLDDPPKDAREAANPIPLDSLPEWGVICGEELSEDALMQGHGDDQN